MWSIVRMFSVLLCCATSASVCIAGDKWVIESVSASYLGTLGGENSFAHDVNDRGDIVGWSDSAAYGVEHAFLYRDGEMLDLGDILGYVPTRAYGLNNHGEVVGAILTYSGQTMKHFQGLYWAPDGVLQGLKSAPFNDPEITGEWSVAYAINNSGGIGGTLCCKSFNNARAGWWANKDAPPFAAPLTPLNGYPSQGYDINEQYHSAGDRYGRGYLHRLSDTLLVPFSVDGSDASEARGINDKDQVVGWYTKYFFNSSQVTERRAFFWNGLSPNSELLGGLPTGRDSAAYEVNNLDFATGWTDVAAAQENTYRKAAFIWHRHFGMIELNAPTTVLWPPIQTECEARSINNLNRLGVIRVVGACSASGATRAARWDVKVKLKKDIVIGPAP